MSISRLLLRLVLGSRLPITAGELRLRGLSAPVTIRRDGRGVPHISVENETDAYFALGFCHGQDRAGQLEVYWRLGRGRLAEWVGPQALVADRMSRRIGFRRAAEAQLQALSPNGRAAFDAFTAGINAGSTLGLKQKPHEFAILGGTPSPWDAADGLGFIKFQSFLLPSNWDVELARLRILLADGASAVLDLDPVSQGRERVKGRKGEGVIETENARDALLEDVRTESAEASSSPLLSSESLLDHLAADLSALQSYLPLGGGSNNWVIAGSRTQSGKPLLASDPHLSPSCPGPWYLAHVQTPRWEVAGAGLAGTPAFAIGHNGFAAWGVTAGLTDNSDFFIETLGPDGKSFRQPDGTFAPCEVVKETIRVKGQPDVTEEVLLTPRGPLLTPLIADVNLAISLSAVWLEPRPIVGFLDAPKARSFDEFRRCFAAWPVLPLNVVYADTEGTIGWQLTGELPQRRGGHGLLPRPADLPDSGWNGFVPFEEMPFAMNPQCGYLATANDPPSQESGDRKQEIAKTESGSLLSPEAKRRSPGPWLGADFIDDYRARRIREQLASRDSGWVPANCTALQCDLQSIPWREIRDSVLSLNAADHDAQAGLTLLREWDGVVDGESPAAAVFELFVSEMCVRVAKAKAPKTWLVALGEGGLGMSRHNLFTDRRVSHISRLLREQPAGWFASWTAEMESALALVVRKLRREAGPGPKYWAWGHLRTLELEHALFGKHRWLGPVFNCGPVPCGGNCNTVSQAAVRPADPTANVNNVANMRAVFDLADLPKSTFVLCGGQSGNPFSPHHADQFPLWQRGEVFTIAWDQADVIRVATETLRLLPS